MLSDKPGASASLITLHRVPNYGSVLQAYATVELLRQLGISATIVDYRRPDLELHNRLWGRHTRIGSSAVGRAAYRATQSGYVKKSESVFGTFVDDMLPLTSPYWDSMDLTAGPPPADIYVVGSDQVWNRRLNVGGTEPYALSFAPPGVPKVALSSSIGAATLSAGDKDFFSSHLRSFDWISVREESARVLLEGLGIRADVILDPTLLFPRRWWESVTTTPPGERYVLAYCLHGDPRLLGRAHEIAARDGATVTQVVSYWRSPSSSRGQLRLPKVGEFLSLVRGAHHVVTDSFHGSCFALNFGRPLTVVPPMGHATRLVDLMGRLGLRSRVLGDPSYDDRARSAILASAEARLDELRDSSLMKVTAGLTKAGLAL